MRQAMKLKYEEGAALVIPNADRNLVFVIYLDDEDGSNPEIAFEPIVAWAVTPYVMRDIDRPSEQVETEFHSGKPIGCAGGTPEVIFDEKTARWWVPEDASGEGLESLMQHFKDKRRREMGVVGLQTQAAREALRG